MTYDRRGLRNREAGDRRRWRASRECWGLATGPQQPQHCGLNPWQLCGPHIPGVGRGEGPSAWQPANGLLVHDPASLSQSPGWPATPLICDRSGASSSLEGPPEGGEGPGRKAPWGPRGQGREAETKSRVCAEAAAALPQTRAPLGPGARGSPLVPQLTSGVTCLTPALGLRHRSPWPSSILESCVLNIVAKGVQAHPQNP